LTDHPKDPPENRRGIQGKLLVKHVAVG